MNCNIPKKPKMVLYKEVEKAPTIHGAMKYRCDNCGKEWWMFLEVGVEDFGENGRPHQPSPFCLLCECGNFAQDVSGIVKHPEGTGKLLSGLKFFAYDNSGKEQACGIPSIYQPKTVR